MNTATNTTPSIGRLALLAFALIFLMTASGCHHHGPRGGDPTPHRTFKKGPPPHLHAPYKKNWHR